MSQQHARTSHGPAGRADTEAPSRGGEAARAPEPFRYSPELPWKPRVSPPSVEDKDACAIYASVRKDATPSREPVDAGAREPPEDAPPRRQRRRRGRRLRHAGRHPAQDLGRRRSAAAATTPRSRSTPPSPSPTSSSTRKQRPREGPPRRPRDPRPRRLPDPRRAVGRGRLARRSGPTAREEEPHFWQIGGPRPRRRRRATASSSTLTIELEEKLGVHVASFSADDLRLQGDGRAEGPRRLLPGPSRRALRDDRLLRPQPLLDQHLAVVHARPAVHRPRPQRRDQHDRAAPPGGADARRADRAPATRTPRT